jgi:hypothetical protein
VDRSISASTVRVRARSAAEHETAEVELDGHHAAAGPGDPGHLRDRAAGIPDMLQQPLGPAGIEAGTGEAEAAGVGNLEADRQPGQLEPLPRFGDHHVAEVHADGAPARGDPGGHLENVAAVPAAHIQHRLTGPQPQFGQRGVLTALHAGQGPRLGQIGDQLCDVRPVRQLEPAQIDGAHLLRLPDAAGRRAGRDRIRAQIAGTVITCPPGRVLTVRMWLVPVPSTSYQPTGNSPASSSAEISPGGMCRITLASPGGRPCRSTTAAK